MVFWYSTCIVFFSYPKGHNQSLLQFCLFHKLNLFKLIKMSLFYLNPIKEHDLKSNYYHLHSRESRVFCLPPLKTQTYILFSYCRWQHLARKSFPVIEPQVNKLRSVRLTQIYREIAPLFCVANSQEKF
jgi:hypothetical protein